ncbi:helix-turn-helix transcriptional regulator [Microvirga pudoricolor]|uniref:helix-turn-helix transcriptional regulator n=1 Tax=Microvirga pudoricolor TaxID=2778729 RepID=UPI00194FB1B5|nr:helix-turn-helix transcriptional regulator [Microvirga pudoricolor]MBM6594152.1 helix-turn-helix transcriptional regulator [Microvirga pudoricolor]
MYFDDFERLSLVGSIYKAVPSEEEWRHVLEKISLYFTAEGALMAPLPSIGERWIWTDGLEGLVKTFTKNNWNGKNDRLKRMQAIARGQAFSAVDQMLFTEEERTHLPFNAEFIRRNGFGPFAAAIFYPRPDQPVYLTMERRMSRPGFESGEKAELDRLLPHIQQAFYLSRQFHASQVSTTLEALHKVGNAAFILTATGQVAAMNRRAEHLLGTAFLLQNGELAACARESKAHLKQFIKALLTSAEGDVPPDPRWLKVSRRETEPVWVQGMPILGAVRDIFQSGRAILIVADPLDKKSPAVPVLKQAFDLTTAEAGIAVALAKGQDTSEIASTLSIKSDTVRLHIKRILKKTQTSRQPELVSLLKDLSFRFDQQN